MLGNDIVDLKLAAKESNWRRKGYLNKICMPLEQQLIMEADDPAVMLWLIWTMKEASYKVMNRLTGLRSYSPSSYVCSSLAIKGTAATALVSFESSALFVRAELSRKLIHSTAVLKEDHLALLKVYYINNSPGYADDFHQIYPDFILTKSSAGLPLIRHIATSRIWEASVSHHGKYAAILCAAPLYSGSLLSAD